MFFPPGFNPEMLTKKPTFDEYYKKRLSEEYAKFSKNPSVSFSAMMVMAKLPEYIKTVGSSVKRSEYVLLVIFQF